MGTILDAPNPNIESHADLAGKADLTRKLAVNVEHLTKRYDEITAVDDLTLSIPSGSFFGFLGPNGAGKSTTIGCLTGLVDPTAGKIELLGKRFTSDAAQMKRRIGVMPEGLALFDHLYAHEFLSFNARIY